jgi:prolipoprotein diacylglyceryltransferase
MLPYINILGLAFPVPALTILIGIWVGITLAERYTSHRHVKSAELYNLVFYALIAGVIGARLAYVAKFPTAFFDNPSSIISPNIGLFDPLGGVAAGLITAGIYWQRKGMPFWPVLDALTPAFAVFGIALPLANLASGNAFGSPTSLPWGIELWGATRHPTQIYEAFGAGVILWIIWPGRETRISKPGTIFIKFVGYSAMARLFFEAFRGETPVTIFNLRVVQVIAWFILALSMWSYSYLMNRGSKTGKNPAQ